MISIAVVGSSRDQPRPKKTSEKSDPTPGLLYRTEWGRRATACRAATISGYLTEPARAGAKVGTMSRWLSAIQFAHQLRDLPDPTTGARVVAVWEGIRRTHGAPPTRQPR